MYPERDKRDPSQGLEWLVRNGAQGWQEGWEKPSCEKMGPKDCVGWRGEVKAQPGQNTQIYLTYLLLQCSAIREGQDFKSNIPHHPPSAETA